jgi:hypothetical protein
MIRVEAERAVIEKVNILLANVPGGAEKAFKGAFARAQSAVRTAATKEISKVYAITQTDVRAESNITLRTRKAENEIIGELSFSGFKIPLYRFGVTPKRPTPREGDFIRVSVMKGTTKLFRHAFNAKIQSGHMGVFERVPGKRMKNRRGGKNELNMHTQAIGKYSDGSDQLYGPSVSGMLENAEVMNEMEEVAINTVNTRLEHEIERILTGYV